MIDIYDLLRGIIFLLIGIIFLIVSTEKGKFDLTNSMIFYGAIMIILSGIIFIVISFK